MSYPISTRDYNISWRALIYWIVFNAVSADPCHKTSVSIESKVKNRNTRLSRNFFNYRSNFHCWFNTYVMLKFQFCRHQHIWKPSVQLTIKYSKTINHIYRHYTYIDNSMCETPLLYSRSWPIYHPNLGKKIWMDFNHRIATLAAFDLHKSWVMFNRISFRYNLGKQILGNV